MSKQLLVDYIPFEVTPQQINESLAKNGKMFSWTFSGKRYDIGTMKDWFQSHLELSFNSDYSQILKEAIGKL